ncbi:hypothetical protein ACOSQ2_022201 [Xanthoceras sorbifolium]
MQTVNSLQLQLLHKIIIKATEPNFYRFSSLTKIPTHTPNALFFNYLIETLNLSNTEAQSISNSPRFSNIKSLENPQSVLDYFRSVGLSETEIRSSVLFQPRILLSDVDRILKPKIEFFQEMGLVGSDLCKFISKNSKLFNSSLEKKMIPCTRILKKILVNDKNNQDLIRVITARSWLITTNPERRLLRNMHSWRAVALLGLSSHSY